MDEKDLPDIHNSKHCLLTLSMPLMGTGNRSAVSNIFFTALNCSTP